MSFQDKFDELDKFEDQANGRNVNPDSVGREVGDVELEQALAEFRMSVRSWSDAELTRPRMAVKAQVRARSWRLAAGWALGCVLAAGGVSGGFYDHHRRVQAEQIRQAEEVQHQKQMAAQKALEEEDLMAKVDSDIAREVPSAMQPLAQLMDADELK